MEKLCGVCGTQKPSSEFYRVPTGPKGTCKSCVIAKEKARYVRKPRVYPPTGMKRCSRCKTVKTIDNFSTSPTTRDGFAYYCRPCAVATTTASRKKDPASHRRSSRKWALANPDRVRDAYLKRQYGITAEIYNAMFAAQKGKCAICSTEQPSIDTRFSFFHVDHDEASGKVRGLLCSTCNTGIGQLRHDKNILLSAIEYLNRTLG